MAEPSLAELQEAFTAGDYSHLHFIFEEYGMYCIENVQKRTGCSEDDAHDVFMDSIIVFRDKIISGEITFLNSIRNYLYTICVNAQMERRRSAIRRYEKTEDINQFLYDDLVGDPFEEEVKILIENHTLMQICFKTLDKLGANCKKVLKLFYVHELSISEIAKRMSLANNNVAKSTKARCFKKWKEMIRALEIKGTEYDS